jgi:hypothetical protein
MFQLGCYNLHCRVIFCHLQWLLIEDHFIVVMMKLSMTYSCKFKPFEQGLTYKSIMFWNYSWSSNPLFPWSPQSLASFRYLQLEFSKIIEWLHNFSKLHTFKHQNVKFIIIRRFCDYALTLVMKSYKTCFLWLSNFVNKKKITLLRLLSIVMNLSVLVSTTSHYNHLDYEFQISKPMYVLSMYIIKY